MKGGKREGAGRPKAEPTTVIRVRLTQPQHAAYVERGAEHWLKRVLDTPEQPPKEKTP
jgi:hypothetical protein